MFVVPELADVEVPAGMRPVVEQAEGRAMWERVPVVSGVLREDSRATRRAVWLALCEHLHETGVIVATQERIAERASVHVGRRVARQTAGNHMRGLVEAGALVVALRGASAEALGTETGRAGAYVIVTAADVEPWTSGDRATLAELENRLNAPGDGVVDELGHLPERSSDCSDLESSHPRMGGDFSYPSPRSKQRDVGADTSRQTVLGRSGDALGLTQRQLHPELYAPQTGPERQQAVLSLIAVMGWAGQQRAEQELSTITRPFFAAGWSTRAIIHAFEHRPDEGAWPCSLPAPHQRDSPNAPAPRSLWAVLTWRLRQWRRDDGTPLDPPVEVFQPRRGRPPGAVSRRRALVELYERLPVTDPRRAELHATLTGSPAPTWQPRGVEAESAVAIERAKLAAHAARRAADRAEREARTDRLRAELDTAPAPAVPVDVDQDQADGPDPAALRQARAILRARAERAGRVVARIPQSPHQEK